MLKCFYRWEFTGKPDPGVDEITNGLKRLVTGVLTHPMTIGKVISAHTPKRKKDKPKSIHLIGTDTPEVSFPTVIFRPIVVFCSEHRQILYAAWINDDPLLCPIVWLFLIKP